MLDAADVLVNVLPVGGVFGRDHAAAVVGRHVAEEVPAGFDEGVHGVGFAPRGLAVGVSRLVIGRVFGERAAAAVRDDVLRQDDGQVAVVHRQVAPCGVVNDGDGAAPVALAADAPVAQAVLGFFFARAAFAERRADGVEGLREVEAVKGAARDKAGVFFRGVPFLPDGGVVVFAVFGDDLFDGQAVFVGKCEVAFVVRGHGHDRTVAVAPEDVVGDPHFQCFATERVDDVAPGRHPFFFHGGDIRLGDGSGLAFVDEGGERGVVLCGSGC